MCRLEAPARLTGNPVGCRDYFAFIAARTSAPAPIRSIATDNPAAGGHQVVHGHAAGAVHAAAMSAVPPGTMVGLLAAPPTPAATSWC